MNNSQGVQYVRTFASGERARVRESRLALITFAYPTFITAGHGCTRAAKVVKMVNNLYTDRTAYLQIQQILYFHNPGIKH